MSTRIESPFPIFTDIDGNPLENGYVYIGVENLDPITNPISVYWDEALTIPAAQPIRTIGGYPSQSGAAGRLFAGSNFSITVQNKNETLVFSLPSEITLDVPVGYFAIATGTANAIELSISSISAYTDNMLFSFQTPLANTSSVTIQVNAIGTKALVKNNSPLSVTDIVADGYYSAIYNQSNDNFELVDFNNDNLAKIDKSIVNNVSSDADITLTADQNLYGRIEITDTGVILTTGRNVITDNIEHTFLFVNSTAQTLTVKTSAGTGIAVAAGEAKELRNDTVNVIAFEASQDTQTGLLSTDDFIHIQDQKTTGSNGGSKVTGTTTKVLNTVVANTIAGASLAANEVTLPAGDYYAEVNTTYIRTNGHRTFLYNVTDASNELVGLSDYQATANADVNSTSYLSGTFTLAAGKNLSVREYINASAAGSGATVGLAAGDGTTEIYTDVKIWKVG